MGRILITGGTGSFGSAMMEHLLNTTEHAVRVLSRDEHKQEALMGRFPPSGLLSYVLADIRQRDRLDIAFDGVDMLVHAAALKTVPAGERAVDQFVQTNIYGSENVARAAIHNGVGQSLFISSDKAVEAYNAYGKTKAAAECLWLQANMQGVSRGCKFAVVRGGNVWASNGSVVRQWRKQVAETGAITVYDPSTTRFHVEMPEWITFCQRALYEMHGGEVFIPKLRAWKLYDLALEFEALGAAPCRVDLQAAREGDKSHEVLIHPMEVPRTVDIGWAYVIEPTATYRSLCSYQPWRGQPMGSWFDYRSCNAPKLSADELRRLLE